MSARVPARLWRWRAPWPAAMLRRGGVVLRFAFFLVVVPLGVLACGDKNSEPEQTGGSPSDSGGSAGNGASSGSAGLGGGGSSAGSGGSAGHAGSKLADAGAAGEVDDMGGDPNVDADHDTISDRDEGAPGRDTDRDGTPDYLDTDADGDGNNDGFEAGDAKLETPPIDSDGDGKPDFEDTDSDNDGISDAVETADGFDTDGDLVPDYLDLDSDNDDASDADEAKFGLDWRKVDSDKDTISDGDEGFGDPDKDGIINALDDDSDGDGFSDAEEAGDKRVDTAPIDTDLDGVADFLDLDADGDGLPDVQEADCGQLETDGDHDGYIDLVEVLTDADPCDDGDTPLDHGVEFYFVLPYGGPEQSSTLRFVPRVQKADVFFNVDTTGSMGGVISTLKTGLSSVIDSTRARVSDSAFGVASFRDFPLGVFGDSSDKPFELLAGITDDKAAAQSAANLLVAGGGADGPEAGFEGLYQVANGSGIVGAAGSFGPFTVAGRTGGGQFRPGALPIIVHATDADAHDTTTSTPANPAYPANYGAHGHDETLTALQHIGARVITIQNGSTTTAGAQLTDISSSTRAVVPACSFKTSNTTWRCGVGMCCLPTATVATLDADNNAQCVLRYQIQGDGTGLADVTTDGIDAIIKYTKFDVRSQGRDDGDAGTPDTSAFLTRVEANTPDASFKPPLEPELSCNPVPKPAAFKGASYNNGFAGFAVGSSNSEREGARLFFSVRARNTTVKEGADPQIFKAFIDVVDEQTGVVLDTQDVVVIVPGVPGGVGVGE